MSIEDFAPDVDIQEELAATEAETPVEVEAQPEVEQQEPKQDRTVPLAALHESRMKEREWREKAVQIERESADRFKRLEERLEKISNPPQQVPAFEEDPAAYLKHQVEETRQLREVDRQQIEQFQQAQNQNHALQRLSNATALSEQEFVKEFPDYLAAVDHLKSVHDRNMLAMGVTDPVERQKAIHQQSLSIAHRALTTGKSPAEVVYNLAKNYGYQAKQDAGKKIESIQKGQAATPSMPSGGKKETSISLAALEQMDDDEFNKLIDDPVQWKKLIKS